MRGKSLFRRIRTNFNSWHTRVRKFVGHGQFVEVRALIPLWELKLDCQLCKEERRDLFSVISQYPGFGTWLSIAVKHISTGLAAKTTHIYHPTVSVGSLRHGFSQGCSPGVSWGWVSSESQVEKGPLPCSLMFLAEFSCSRSSVPLQFPCGSP